MIKREGLDRPLVDMKLNSFGYNLRILRTTSGRTLKEKAAKLNISASHLSKIERNKIKPSASLLVKILAGINEYYIDKFGWAEI